MRPDQNDLKLLRPAGLEPAAYWFEASRSIQLSYGRIAPYYTSARLMVDILCLGTKKEVHQLNYLSILQLSFAETGESPKVLAVGNFLPSKLSKL